MNLHNVVRGAISAVNPPLPGVWRKNTDYTTGPSGKRTPVYAAVVNMPLQVQALSGKDLRLLDSLNIQGVQRAIYANGNIQGVNRVNRQGGDLLQFTDSEFGLSWWLVEIVLETWPTGWCKVGVTLQMTGP